jgi:hypothetical protein
MAKMFFSLGFWMTIVLFISFGYVFGAEFPHLTTYSAEEKSMDAPVAPRDEAPLYLDSTNRYGAGTEDRERSECAPEPLDKFPPSYSAERQELRYAPGLSITLGDKPRRPSLCAGPVEIPRS